MYAKAFAQALEGNEIPIDGLEGYSIGNVFEGENGRTLTIVDYDTGDTQSMSRLSSQPSVTVEIETPNTGCSAKKGDDDEFRVAYANQFRRQFGLEPISPTKLQSRTKKETRKLSVQEFLELIEAFEG